MFAREKIRGFQVQRERLQRHRTIVIEEHFADGEKFCARADAADLVQELALRVHAEADEVQILFHLLNLPLI